MLDRTGDAHPVTAIASTRPAWSSAGVSTRVLAALAVPGLGAATGARRRCSHAPVRSRERQRIFAGELVTKANTGPRSIVSWRSPSVLLARDALPDIANRTTA